MGATVDRNVAVVAALDALAVAAGTAAAFALGTAVHHYESLDPGHVASLAFPAVLVCIAVTLTALRAAGLYGEHATRASFLEIAGVLAWAMAPLAFGALYWEWAPEGPLMVVAAGFALTAGLLWAARVLRRRRS
jgi:hypothetical protein